MYKKIIGIYKITSPTNKIYIGQSTNISQRFNSYRNYKCKGQSKLYNSLKKYGHEKHKFEITMQCSKEELNQFEIYYIELFQTFNSKYGLNLQAGGYNGSPSEETRNKIREINLGHKHSEETKEKLRISSTGRKHSKETISKMKLVRRTEEYKLNLSIKLKGRKQSEEHNLKNKLSHLGIKHSEEQKQKISIGNKNKKRSSESIERYRQAALNRSPEHKENIRLSILKRKENENN